MLKKILVSPLLALSLIVAQPLWANTKAEDTCHCQRLEHLTETLHLDNEQVKKIKEIKTDMRSKLEEKVKQIRSLRNQIHHLVASDKLDEEKLDNLIKEKTTLNAEITKEKALAKNKMFNVLNKKQQEQFQEMLTKWETNKHHKKCLCPVKKG